MIFGKKSCKSCGEKLDGKWNFCPKCGTSLKERNAFDDFNREIKMMNRAFGFTKILGGPKINLRPTENGVNIIITPGNMKPKIIEERPISKPKKPVKIPKSIEEPETRIEKKGGRQTIMLSLPGVKQEDIEVKRFESSVEIKAFVGDKAYFKLIPVPSNAAINKTFENEMLKIEVLR